jgi:1-acyl-sn-glycerol-3-phosphate acyltransferase
VQLARSLVYTLLLFLTTLVFGFIVLVGAVLPLSLQQRYAIPRAWGRSLLWMLKVICRLDYVIEGQENLPKEPFISLWKHSSSWETMAQMFVVPPAAWLLKREVTWIPVIGWAVSTYKPIAINRRAGHSAVNQVVKQGRERLAAGMGVIVYPEGTRSPRVRRAGTASVAHCSRHRLARRSCLLRTTRGTSGRDAV